MQTKTYSMLLLLVVVLVGNGASALPGFDLNSILQKYEGTVNLYKAFYEYVGAILNQGIPALNVPPFDPAHSNATISLLNPYDPDFPNYTNIEVWNNAGINISGFSLFEVPTADLDLEELSAKLELDWDDVGLVFLDVNATAQDIDGSLKWYHCSNVYADIGGNNFTSNKQLEVVGQQLHVKTFELGYSWLYITVLVFDADCEGDDEIVFPFLDTILDALIKLTDETIPKTLQEISILSTIVLDDIFALRNVTDDGSSIAKPEAANRLLQSEAVGREAVKLSTTRQDYLNKADKRQNRDDVVLKWTF